MPVPDRTGRHRADRVRRVDGPVVLPVNFVFFQESLVIRAAEGSVIDGHADGPIALEVDHIDEALRPGWSVLVRGQAHRVLHPAELRRPAGRRRGVALGGR
jgi:nitroimidazol reductase NimA-like FMN-containing flavoprotein (pyridoxamine 5'-phosphate oxidase superfamily)